MTAVHTSKPKTPTAFELKSAALTLISVVIKTTDLALLAQEFSALLAGTPGLFEQDPVVIDVSPLRETPAPINFVALVALLRQHQMQPVAVKGANAEQAAAALAAGLADAPEGHQPTVRTPVAADAPPEVPPEPATEAHSRPTLVATAMPTMVLDRPLRSGQQVYARGADLVVMAAVSFGAEVIADGHIHIYAPLRGRAIAGARGNKDARIFTTCMEPQLVSIAGIYRTSETDLPAAVQGKPAQVRLDGERLVIEPIPV
jgi:septum site-determining protein MinC